MNHACLAAALVSASLLVACAQNSANPPVGATPATASIAGPAGARFDGRYTGVADQTMNRNSTCGPQQIPQALMISNGNARYVVDRTRNIIATGPVQADGSITLTSDAGGNNTVTGKVENDVFTGNYRSTGCGRSLSLRKQG